MSYRTCRKTQQTSNNPSPVPISVPLQTIGGVLTDVVEPVQGVAAKNAKRVLINLHGGAFLWGARSGALVESIPVARAFPPRWCPDSRRRC